jgi:hypothetical protein
MRRLVSILLLIAAGGCASFKPEPVANGARTLTKHAFSKAAGRRVARGRA